MLLFNLLKKKSKKLELDKSSFIYLQKKKSNKKYRFFIHINKRIKTCKSLHIIMTTNQDVNFYNLHRKMTMFIIQPLEKKSCLFTSPPFSPNNSLKKLTKECTQKKISIVQYYQDTYTRCFISLKALKHTCVSCIISRPKSKVLNVHFVRITEQRQRLHTCSFCPSIAPQ